MATNIFSASFFTHHGTGVSKQLLWENRSYCYNTKRNESINVLRYQVHNHDYNLVTPSHNSYRSFQKDNSTYKINCRQLKQTSNSLTKHQ